MKRLKMYLQFRNFVINNFYKFNVIYGMNILSFNLFFILLKDLSYQAES